MKRQISPFHFQLMQSVYKSSLLLVEVADQCRFDLQLEFMLLIIWVCFVVLQT